MRGEEDRATTTSTCARIIRHIGISNIGKGVRITARKRVRSLIIGIRIVATEIRHRSCWSGRCMLKWGLNLAWMLMLVLVGIRHLERAVEE